MAGSSKITGLDDFAKIGKELYNSSEEHPTPLFAKITGKIPDWFEGTLIRVGPGKFEWGKSSYNHWFDGEALMHKFDVSKGTVKYSSEFLHSQSYDKSKKYGRVATPGFATWAPPDPCKNIFQRFFLYFLPPAMSDNCNVNMVKIKEEIYASTETPYIYHIDPSILGTLEEHDLKSTLNGPRSLLAHPHYDEAGYVYNVSTNWLSSRYEIFRIPPNSNATDPFSGATIIATVPSSFSSPAYFHSFGMSENFFILIENPLVMKSLWKMITMNFLENSFLDVLEWKPELKTRMNLINRHTGKVEKTFLLDQIFTFHHVNAYEESGQIVVDVCGYPDASVIEAFYLRKLRNGLKGVDYTIPMLRRYRLPIPSTGQVTKEPETLPKLANGEQFEVICEGYEMPRINYSYNAKKYKFSYGTVFRDKNYFLENIAKVNVDTKEVVSWVEEHSYPSEPVFVPAPDAKEEDDGIVLSAVVGVLGKPSFLLFLDGKTFTEVARAVVPCKLAMTFHGAYLH